ncbi:nucleotidyltransferase family protein, partial [Neobacillus drentensis]|uniref:nucleotidyltransferase family protein n=1 Tax=Neobacillus drentensis TaxID=220684 RepID=UPI003002BDE0
NNSEPLRRFFKVLQNSELPPDYYIGAGCITNTVWNYLSGFPLNYGISDVDVVYYDREDLSRDSEYKYKEELVCKLGNFPFKLDVKNEAGVHLWYEKKFGFSIKPYKSLETAIDSWPTTATSLGIRKEKTGSYKIYAPYKLDDLFSMIVRPNKLMVNREIFEKKVDKWKEKWPDLTIIPW